MIGPEHAWILAGALVIDGLVGDPPALWRRLPHPAALLGQLIASADRRLNRPDAPPGTRKALGALAIGAVVTSAVAVGWALDRGFAWLAHGWIGHTIVVAVMLAGRSLYDHVAAVAAALEGGDLADGRDAVAHIVGRDPQSLDEPGVCRAAIESTAENFSDGVVAPALWFLLFGLPGLLAYKAVNTADSMIGYKTPRYRDFGWAAARLDDLANLLPSRLAGSLIAAAAPLAGGSAMAAYRAMGREASHHRSPNAGWPEAAMAAGLGVALSGPRRYGGIVTDDPTLNPSGRRQATPADIRRGLRLYVMAWGGLLVIVSLVAAAVALAG